MRTVTLDEATWEIGYAAEAHDSPFFFLVGAGVSAPEIPLAAAIADDCQKRAESTRSHAVAPSDPLDRYSFWFERAFPQPRQRQRYLAELLGDARISHANLRLAHLLSAGVLGRLAITLNFDEGLQRALALFDVPFLVCDHPATVERIEPDRETTQIVHVHGTYWFYDCCNLRGEIADRASPVTQGMQSLLDRVLANRSPLVLGYSGWESDVVMTSLRRRLAGRLPYNIYWFSYSGDVETLPNWLRDHQDVVLVVPTRPEDVYDDSVSDQSSVEEAVLEAATCLEAMIRHFALSPPAAVEDPIGALADRLKRQVPSLGVDAGYEDLYQLGGVVASLDEMLDQMKGNPTSTIEEAREAYRLSNYEQALELCLAIPDGGDETEAQVASMIASSLVRAGTPIETLIAEQPSAVDRVRAAAKRAPRLRLQLGTLLNAYGRALASRRPEVALEVLDEATSLDGGTSQARKRQLVRAYGSKANAYAALGRWSDVLTVLDQIFAIAEDDPQLGKQVLTAEVNRATALARSGHAREAVEIYRRIHATLPAGMSERAYWRFMRRFMEAAETSGEGMELRGLAARVLFEASELEDPEIAQEAVEFAQRVTGDDTSD